MPGLAGATYGQGDYGNATARTSALDPNPAAPKYSIALWMVAGTAPANNVYVWGVADAANPDRSGITLHVHRNLLEFYCQTSVTRQVSELYWDLQAGRWTHSVVTWDGARNVLYVNGRAVQHVANVQAVDVAGTRCAFIATGCGDDTTGMLRVFDMRIFPDTALNPAEARAAMDPRINFDPARCKGRYARYFWAPVASGKMYDESGNGNDLTLAGTAAQCASCEEPPWRKALW